MFDPKVLKMSYALGDSQGDSRLAQRKYIIAHESGYSKDTEYPNMLLNEVQNMHSNFNNAYTTHFVGFMDSANEAQIYQIGEPGYVSWGALSANPYAPVQIEFAEVYQNDKAKFKVAYKLYIEALRYYANLYGIPLKLDEPGNGIKSHLWVTKNYGGTHTDPYDYFATMGISKAQFKHDVENGITDTVAKPVVKSTINNVVTASSKSVKGFTTYASTGKANTDTNISPNSSWKSNNIVVINQKAYFQIGKDIYLPQESTTLKGKLVINYVAGYGVLAFDSKGNSIPDSNRTFKGGTEWITTDNLTDIPKIGWCYKVATNTYVPVKYQVGSGFIGD